MSQSCCHEGDSAAVLHLGGLLPTASENRTDTANHRLHVLDLSVPMAAEGLVEAGEAVVDSGMKIGAIAHEATRLIAALHLGGAEARATIAGVRAEARLQEGESVITVLQEAEGGVALAIQMPATGVIAAIAAVAGTVVDADDDCTTKEYLFGVRGMELGCLEHLWVRQVRQWHCTTTYRVLSKAFSGEGKRRVLFRSKHVERSVWTILTG